MAIAPKDAKILWDLLDWLRLADIAVAQDSQGETRHGHHL